MLSGLLSFIITNASVRHPGGLGGNKHVWVKSGHGPSIPSYFLSVLATVFFQIKANITFNEKEMHQQLRQKKKIHAQEVCGPLTVKPFNSLLTVTSYLVPIELTERCSGRNHNGSVLGWACSPRSGRNKRSHPAKATQICLQPQTGSSWQTRPGKRVATLTPA